ncbi:hypothetical protein CRUP_022792, partial [Coryphaenoides rupestris]
VDIMQMCVVEVTSRPDKPLFHLEHYIEGKYIKYNSNSGFVRDDNIRLTPQAFSHFTFERSGHKLIVVDIQGVLLCVRGMALYFHSHLCNKICKSMGLTPFDHSSAERSQLDGTSKLLTVLRGGEEQCGSPRIRTFSRVALPPPLLLPASRRTSSADDNDEPTAAAAGRDSIAVLASPHALPPPWAHTQLPGQVTRSGGDSGYPSERRSEGDQQDHVDGLTEEKWTFYHSSRDNVHRPSCVAVEMERLSSALLVKKIGQSVLGKVHLAMVRYHEAGRFCEKDEDWDKDSALYHLERASMCGELEAIVALGQCYMQLPHHILSDVELEGNAGNRMKGFKYLIQAAKAGDRHSMILVARAFDTGVNLSADRSSGGTRSDRGAWVVCGLFLPPFSLIFNRAGSTDWVQAVFWYTSALNMCDDDEGGDFDGLQDDPRYLVLARHGGDGTRRGASSSPQTPRKQVICFTEAAEAAMEAMKGRLANQY